MIHINLKEKALVSSETGKLVRPECFDSLVIYHAYLVGRNHAAFAQKMLQEVFAGSQYISKMVLLAQKNTLDPSA